MLTTEPGLDHVVFKISEEGLERWKVLSILLLNTLGVNQQSDIKVLYRGDIIIISIINNNNNSIIRSFFKIRWILR